MDRKEQYTNIFRATGRGILNDISASTNSVAQNSKHVCILEDSIEVLAKKIRRMDDIDNWLNKIPFDLKGLKTNELIELLMFFHNINFSYWGEPKWTIVVDDERLDGSYALLYCSLQLLKEEGFNPYNISNISFKKFSKFLKGNIDIPLLKERYIRTISLYLSISNLLNDMNLSCSYDLLNKLSLDDETIFGYIVTMFGSTSDVNLFHDKVLYNGNEIFFYKRAQLLTSDIIYVLNTYEKSNIDISNLRGCADYKIPQILEASGVLHYEKELLSKIVSKQEIMPGSKYEVEIRANTLEVIDKVYNSLNKTLTRMQINDRIFILSQKGNQRVFPYHRTRTQDY